MADYQDTPSDNGDSLDPNSGRFAVGSRVPFTRGGSEYMDLDRIFDMLGNRRRRLILRYFSQGDNTEAGVHDLVGYILEWESEIGRGNQPPSQSDIELTLIHAHLPKLANHGVIDLNREEGVVRYEGDAILERFLEVTREVSPFP